MQNNPLQSYEKYKSECNELLSIVPAPDKLPSFFRSNQQYQKALQEVFEKKMLNPLAHKSFCIEMHWCYVDPRNGKKYRKVKCYNASDIENLFFEVLVEEHKKKEEARRAEEERKSSPQYERSKVNDGLRFDVFKRDGYRCQMCGRSPQKDGVTLELDHIVPVSKGGKTELDNLQTLCHECNSGKRAKDM